MFCFPKSRINENGGKLIPVLNLGPIEFNLVSEGHSVVSKLVSGFVRVLENLESPGILLWHFPGLESPGKRPLVLESSGNLLNSTKNMKCMEGSREN